MTTQNPCRYTDCAKQITVAQSILTLSMPVVKALFPNKELKEISDFQNGKEIIWLEVTCDLFTLVCLFDEDHICKGAFLDDLKELASYIDYCTQTYRYDPALKGWIIGDCHITVDAGSEEFCLAVLPIPVQP